MADDLRDLDPFEPSSSVYFDPGIRKIVDPPAPPPFIAGVSNDAQDGLSPWLIAAAVLAFCCLVVSTDNAAHLAWRAGAVATLVLAVAIAGALWVRQVFTGREPSGRAASGARSRRR